MNEVKERGKPVHFVEPAGERRGKIKPESIYVHLCDPIAQRIHHHLEHVRMPHVEGIAGPRIIDVAEWIIRIKPVIGGIVQSTE